MGWNGAPVTTGPGPNRGCVSVGPIVAGVKGTIGNGVGISGTILEALSKGRREGRGEVIKVDGQVRFVSDPIRVDS